MRTGRRALLGFRLTDRPKVTEPLRLVAEGFVNVVNLSDLSPRQADVVISQFMDEVLIDTDILSPLKRRRLYFCFPLLPHPSRSGSVSQGLHS